MFRTLQHPQLLGEALCLLGAANVWGRFGNVFFIYIYKKSAVITVLHFREGPQPQKES